MKFRLLFSLLLLFLLSFPAWAQVSPKQSPVKPASSIVEPAPATAPTTSSPLPGQNLAPISTATSIGNPSKPGSASPKKKTVNDGLIHLIWGKPRSYQASNDAPILNYLNLMGGSYSPKNHLLPTFFKQTKLNAGNNTATASVVNPNYEPLTAEELKALDSNKKWVGADIAPKIKVVTALKQFYVNISFIPVRKNAATGGYEKLISFKLDIHQSREELKAVKPAVTFASNSVLQSGTWFRIGVTADGIYELDSAFFTKMGVDLLNLVPANIRIYGNGGAMLPQSNAAYRADDLIENAIYVKGQTDAYFKPGDYVLFYAQSPVVWAYDASDTHFHHTVNVYSDTTFYFINIDGIGAAKNIANEVSLTTTPTNTVTTFDDYAYHELDGVNLIQSGCEWMGEYFEATTTYSFSFPFTNISTSGPVYVNTAITSVNCNGSSSYSVASGAAGGTTASIASSNCSFDGDPYAVMGTSTYTYTPASGTLNVPVTVTKETPGAIGWLYYIETNVRRALVMPSNQSQMEFRDSKSVGSGNISLFTISSNAPIQVWDVTNPQSVDSIHLSKAGGSYSFELPTNTLNQYIAFNYTGGSFLTPTYFGKVANQNLHADSEADLIIVTNPLFIEQANQLASFHREHDNLKVNVVTTQQVYNEFSSGLQDPTAIRDYLRMLYDRATGYANTPKYLLLFGGGSYDPKHRLSGNTNYVVAYESGDSFDPIGSYVSDDYFVLLDSTVTTPPEVNPYPLDLSVGRFSVDNVTEAQTCVNKVIIYETPSGQSAAPSTNCCAATNQYTLGNWRNTVCFIAQDGDENLFEWYSEQMADYIDANFKNLNVNKIYFDAYPIVETPGGERYPAVNAAIDNQMNEGLLMYNYEGHGGPTGLGIERTLDFTDIASWTNLYAMPFFFNGSCAFGEWDNPLQISGGQVSVNLPSGGVISMVSATRGVYLGPNAALNLSFIDSLYSLLPDGSLPRIGDLLTKAVNVQGGTQGGGNVNNLSYSLLGDPAVRLNYPKYNVVTGSINAKAVTPASPTDTLNALEKVTISGYVADSTGNTLTSFNGLLTPTIYDKPVSITTLDNGGGDPNPDTAYTFGIQNSELYRGLISVNNGKFTFTYVMPKDILYYYGFGKISYYAQNGTTDATGNYQNIEIGGTSPTAHNNGLGPNIRLYMNDSNFAYDGLTNQSPNLYAIVFDSNGINTSGTTVGHDITAVLDNNTANTYDISSYYQPALNSYQKGTITYPLSSLTNGTHTLSLRVWNVYDNTSMATTEFNVESQSNLQLQHVLNYPDPFTTHTQFYFEINEVCDQMDVQIQIFSVSGKLVKNILTSVKTNSFRSEPIDWDGRDDYGERIANGVYIYHLKVRTSSGLTADTYQKLVIL